MTKRVALKRGLRWATESERMIGQIESGRANREVTLGDLRGSGPEDQLQDSDMCEHR